MIKVLFAGFYSSVQDLGRNSFQSLGVPSSGAMDLYAFNIVNAILGNKKDSAVLEITMVGPKLEFCCDTQIAIAGAGITIKLNNIIIDAFKLINVNKGNILSFERLQKGFRSYIAVSGGFQTEYVLNSRSMYKGITMKYMLQKGDVLEISPRNNVTRKYSSVKFSGKYLEEKSIKVFRGPEFEQLSSCQIDKLFDQEFTISNNNSRMAYQLEELVLNELDELITSLVLPGTIQLTPLGKLIILMRDCQTTGGYPRILQLKEESINILSQKKVGDKIKFELIDYQS